MNALIPEIEQFRSTTEGFDQKYRICEEVTERDGGENRNGVRRGNATCLTTLMPSGFLIKTASRRSRVTDVFDIDDDDRRWRQIQNSDIEKPGEDAESEKGTRGPLVRNSLGHGERAGRVEREQTQIK